MSYFLLRTAAFGLVFLLGNSPVTANVDEFQTKPVVTSDERLRSYVAHLELQLETRLKLLRRGASSEGEVDRIRALLAKAKHDLALSENNLEGVAEQTRLLLEIRERQLRRLQKMRDKGYAFNRREIEAQRRVAVNRYLLAELEGRHGLALEQLRRTVELCQKEVVWFERAVAQKLVIRPELSRARNRLICAQYRLSKAIAQPEDVIDQLRDSVELFQNDWRQVKQLYDQKKATFIEEYFARYYLLNAKLRLASAEKMPDVIQKLLRELVRLHTDVLKRDLVWVAYTQNAKELLENSIAVELNRDTQRLEVALKTGALSDDLTLAELDL